MSSLLSLFCHPLFISIFAVFEVVNSETLLQLECPCPVKLNGIVIFMESPSHFQRFFALRIDKSTSVDLQSTSSDDQQLLVTVFPGEVIETNSVSQLISII